MRLPAGPIEPSCSVQKAALPITRLSIIRPATLTFTASALELLARQRVVLAQQFVCVVRGLKSFGKATPWRRMAASFSRRSVISWGVVCHGGLSLSGQFYGRASGVLVGDACRPIKSPKPRFERSASAPCSHSTARRIATRPLRLPFRHDMAQGRAGLLRATLTLLAGGALAQALPLLLGPWLTRLYVPEEFGHYTVFAAVAANFAVVACGRYDFALPLARDETEARDLMALCLRVLVAVTLSDGALAGAAVVIAERQRYWCWLPLAVASAGAVQWLTLWATRAERFAGCRQARFTQYGGGALAQVAGGLAQLGTSGLVIGPVVAATAALGWLRRPAPSGGWRRLWRVPRAGWWAAARRHREFPLLNTPHAFAGALQDTLAVALLVAHRARLPPASGGWRCAT